MTRAAPQRLGRYRILDEIGRGAMGVVYRGQDALLERAVALKTVLMSFPAEDHEGYLARFRQEARALASLNHPAIISLYDYGDEGDIAYMAMELLEGRELRDLLDEARLPVAAAVDIAVQVAEGLAFAHARGVVHRDIKPGNIMVLEGQRAKIMDFGIARVRSSDVKTQTGMMLGSPKYMSPEQILGQAADPRSDIFSLGVVLHEMLSGAPPFSGDDIPQLMYQVCNTRHTPPSRLNPLVTEMLDLVVGKALEKDPGSRYQDAAGLAADLRRCLAESPREAAPEAPRAAGPEGEALAATQATLAGTMAQGVAIGMLPWRRFDSTRALERLAHPQREDRTLLSPAGPGSARWTGLAKDRLVQGGAAALAAAVAIALAIALG